MITYCEDCVHCIPHKNMEYAMCKEYLKEDTSMSLVVKNTKKEQLHCQLVRKYYETDGCCTKFCGKVSE